MPEEKNIADAQGILLIQSMINKAKNRFNETGAIYIFCGWLILLCCVIQFSMLYFFKNENAYYIWYLTWIAPVYQVFYFRKRKKIDVAKTYTDNIISFVWLTFIICLTMIVFILMHFNAFAGINTAVLIMYGMPTILSGVILKFKPLLAGGICCWLLALLSTQFVYEFQLLLIAFAVAAAWIVPGYLLKQRFKKETLLGYK